MSTTEEAYQKRIAELEKLVRQQDIILNRNHFYTVYLSTSGDIMQNTLRLISEENAKVVPSALAQKTLADCDGIWNSDFMPFMPTVEENPTRRYPFWIEVFSAIMGDYLEFYRQDFDNELKKKGRDLDECMHAISLDMIDDIGEMQKIVEWSPEYQVIAVDVAVRAYLLSSIMSMKDTDLTDQELVDILFANVNSPYPKRNAEPA